MTRMLITCSAAALLLGACTTTNPNGTPMTPAQKFSAACDGYLAGKDTLGPLIENVAAKDPTGAAVYSAAVFTFDTACQKNQDGTYVEANGPNLAALLPKVLQAGGYLTVLFLPKAT